MSEGARERYHTLSSARMIVNFLTNCIAMEDYPFQGGMYSSPDH